MIQTEIIAKAAVQDFGSHLPIYDVKDPNPFNFDNKDDETNFEVPVRTKGIHVIGGFIGELIITFTALVDYILAAPQHADFEIKADDFVTFLTNYLGPESGFPDGICHLILKNNPQSRKSNFKVKNSSSSSSSSSSSKSSSDLEKSKWTPEDLASYATRA